MLPMIISRYVMLSVGKGWVLLSTSHLGGAEGRDGGTEGGRGGLRKIGLFYVQVVVSSIKVNQPSMFDQL